MTIARVTEIKASSTRSFDDAIKAGIARANKTYTTSNLPGSRTRKSSLMKRQH